MKHFIMILLAAIASVSLLAAALLTMAPPRVVIKEVPVEVIQERIKVINPCEQHNLETTSIKEVKYFNGEVRIGIICKKSG